MSPFPTGTETLGDIPFAAQFFDKGGEVYNVMHPDFGAKGDGTTDDSAALAAAITAASGKTLLIPPGTYLTNPLTFNASSSPSTVIAHGAILKANAAGTLLTIENVHNLVRTFHMVGLRLNGNAEVGTTGLKIHGGQNIRLSDIEVFGFSGIGFHLSGESGFGIYYCQFENCRAGQTFGNGNGGNGWEIKSIGAGNFIASNTFVNCKSTWNKGHGYDVDWASLTWVGCEAEKNDLYGWNYDNTYEALFVGGYSEHNHENYATDNASDATGDLSFNISANTTGFKVLGGRHIGAVATWQNLAGNVFWPTNSTTSPRITNLGSLRLFGDLILGAGAGLGGEGATPGANIINWGGDLVFQRSGTSVFGITASDFRALKPIKVQDTAARLYAGAGTPEGAVTAAIGSVYLRTDGGASTSLYVKESGAGSTGWVAK